MTAVFQFLLLVGCVARSRSSDFQARIRASLEESLARYPAVENSTEDAARHMKSLLFEKKYSVLVYEGRIIVDRRFLEGGKNAKHVNVVASMLARGSLPNAAYFFSGESTGWCDVDKVGRPAVSPCLVIAKVAGHGMRGVLAPNPYFEDVGSWESVRRGIRSWSERRPFDARRPRPSKCRNDGARARGPQQGTTSSPSAHAALNVKQTPSRAHRDTPRRILAAL